VPASSSLPASSSALPSSSILAIPSVLPDGGLPVLSSLPLPVDKRD
jgi:hypothetical protein